MVSVKNLDVTREKVSSRRINLECNTYVHESNARNLPYLNYQKPFVLLIIVYTLFSTKLEIRAKEFLPGSKGVGSETEDAGGKEMSERRGKK
jgi:hypothetical protein